MYTCVGVGHALVHTGAHSCVYLRAWRCVVLRKHPLCVFEADALTGFTDVAGFVGQESQGSSCLHLARTLEASTTISGY